MSARWVHPDLCFSIIDLKAYTEETYGRMREDTTDDIDKDQKRSAALIKSLSVGTHSTFKCCLVALTSSDRIHWIDSLMTSSHLCVAESCSYLWKPCGTPGKTWMRVGTLLPLLVQGLKCSQFSPTCWPEASRHIKAPHLSNHPFRRPGR